MVKLSPEEEARQTVEWLGEMRTYETPEELKYVPRFDDTAGVLKLVLDDRLPLEGEILEGVEKFLATPVSKIDLDDSYYYTEASYEVIERVLEGLKMLPSVVEVLSPMVYSPDPIPLPRRLSLVEAFDGIVEHIKFDSIEEECQVFMDIVDSFLDEFNREMNAKWADLEAPLEIDEVKMEGDLLVWDSLFESSLVESGVEK